MVHREGIDELKQDQQTAGRNKKRGVDDEASSKAESQRVLNNPGSSSGVVRGHGVVSDRLEDEGAKRARVYEERDNRCKAEVRQ